MHTKSQWRAASAGPMPRSSSRSSMCVPIVMGRPGSAARIAPAMRSSQASPVRRSGGTVQLEFSLPRSHAQIAGCPARARAAAPASRSWAAVISGSVYQFRRPDSSGCTRPPETTRKRRSRHPSPVAQAGIQLTPLMWPVNRVTISSTPASPAAPATSTRWPRTSGSTVPAAGWASSQGRKIRTESNPAPAARRKCLLVRAGS